jgi:hypothetical protein
VRLASVAAVAAVVAMIKLGAASAGGAGGAEGSQVPVGPAPVVEASASAEIAPVKAEDTSVHVATIRKAIVAFNKAVEKGGMIAAAESSRLCFDGLAAEPMWQSLDYCLAFDFAAQDLLDGPSSSSVDQLSYFEDARITERHRSALGIVAKRDFVFSDPRLTDVRDRTQEQTLLLADEKEAAFSKAAAEATEAARTASVEDEGEGDESASDQSSENGPPALAGKLVPFPFHGTYRTSIHECGRTAESALRIGLRQVDFYESTAIVRAVSQTSGGILVEAQNTGEGRTWGTRTKFALSADRRLLTATHEDGVSFTRVRCP